MDQVLRRNTRFHGIGPEGRLYGVSSLLDLVSEIDTIFRAEVGQRNPEQGRCQGIPLLDEDISGETG